MNENTSRVIEVDIDEILPNRFQPRIQFDEDKILELSDSIKEHGVIQPLVVRTIGDKYEIIAGERRYKASVLAGKETVPVIVKNLNDKDSAEIALIENIQRKNLTPIEEALSYKKILDMGYITQENLASKLGKTQSTVANKIRLLNLSDEVQEALLENKISERHARSLLKLLTSQEQNEMLNRIISERLTVRRTDEEIEKIKNQSLDTNNDTTQKIIEKGEIDMNNNMFGMNNIPQSQPSVPNFDIFGGNAPMPQQPTEVQPVVNPVPEVQPIVEPIPQSVPSTSEFITMPQMTNFDIFGGNSTTQQPTEAQPVVNPVPEVQPIVEPIPQSVPSTSEFITMPQMTNFDIFGSNPTTQQPTEVQPVVNPVSEVQPVVEPIPQSVPSTSEFITMPQMTNFDIFGGNAPMPQQTNEVQPMVNPVPEVQPVKQDLENIPPIGPGLPGYVAPEESMVESQIPVTAPIIESPIVDKSTEMTQQSESLFSFGNMNSLETTNEVKPEPATIEEIKIPDPIIVTDYSKQYDPIMPQLEPLAPTIDFKEVISAIRECSNKIEQYGFKIDVEEYDLANLYQVIFKIEK